MPGRIHWLAIGCVLALASTAAADPLRVLVTNDDGIGAPGIDVLVRALTANPNLAVTVIAPATNSSGTGARLANFDFVERVPF